MSRVRKKLILDNLKERLDDAEATNQALRRVLMNRFLLSAGDIAQSVDEELRRGAGMNPSASALTRQQRIAERQKTDPSVIAAAGRGSASYLSVDAALLDALLQGIHSFVICDASLPDVPITFASEGFYVLTQYTHREVLGRNCRFLQGPETDPASVTKIREGVRRGEDTSVRCVRRACCHNAIPSAHSLKRTPSPPPLPCPSPGDAPELQEGRDKVLESLLRRASAGH